MQKIKPTFALTMIVVFFSILVKSFILYLIGQQDNWSAWTALIATDCFVFIVDIHRKT